MCHTATHRGMTLLETLAALGLLGALAASAFGWITTSQKSLAETAKTTAWAQAAEAALSQLHDDLVTLDRASDLRIAIEAGRSNQGISDAEPVESMTFASRSAGIGPCEIRYEHDKELGTLTRIIGNEPRVLIGELDLVEIERLAATDQYKNQPLAVTVRLLSIDGDAIKRMIPLHGREIGP